MATGDDLSDEAQSPRLQGRAHKNQDILPQGVWIRHPETGVVHLVNHKYQVNRLLLEGGRVVEQPEPTKTPVSVKTPAEMRDERHAEIARLKAEIAAKEPTNGSTSDDVTNNSPHAPHDRGPGRAKSAVS